MRNLDTLLSMWATFSEDYYKNLLAEIHPEAIPFEIKGLDGKVVWRVVEVLGDAVTS